MLAEVDASTPMSNYQINTKSHKPLYANVVSVGRSVSVKHSFMIVASAFSSDRLVLADDLYIVQQRYDFCRPCTWLSKKLQNLLLKVS